VPLDQIDSLKREGFIFKSAVAARTMMLMLRLPDSDALRKSEVREALAYAIDAQQIFNSLIKGYGRLALGQPVGPDGFGHNPSLKPHPYDPAKAKQLLAKAGYQNGLALDMDTTSGYFPADIETAQAVQGYLGAVGIKVNILKMELGEFLRRTDRGAHAATFLGAYNYYPVMDGDFVLQWFWSKHPVRVGMYPDFDRFFEASRRETDPAKRLQLLQDANKVLSNEVAAVFLYQPPDLYAVNPKIEGLTARPDLVVDLSTVGVR